MARSNSDDIIDYMTEETLLELISEPLEARLSPDQAFFRIFHNGKVLDVPLCWGRFSKNAIQSIEPIIIDQFSDEAFLSALSIFLEKKILSVSFTFSGEKVLVNITFEESQQAKIKSAA